MVGEVLLDVSGLAPPEPMQEILAAVRALEPGQCLRVRHRREPFPIYPMLEELGCAHRVCPKTAAAPFEMLVWRRADTAVDAACGPADPLAPPPPGADCCC